MQVKVVGVCGGSCSGKTTFSRRAFDMLGPDKSGILYQDNYYFDQSNQNAIDQCQNMNFDQPEAIDFELMAEHLRILKQGKTIDVPLYDFRTHTRTEKTFQFRPKPVIFLDGILILTQPEVRELMDDSIFIECDEELRFQRRLARDTVERGRTRGEIQSQFQSMVNPMHNKHVEPSKEYAKRVIPQIDYIQNCDKMIRGLDLDFI